MTFLEREKSFTLMEVLVVVIIVSLVAGFGITSYYKTQERGYVKNAMSQLKMVEKAQEIYKIDHDAYYPETGKGDKGYTQINSDLNIFINPTGFTYTCFDTRDSGSYHCTAVRDGQENPAEAYSIVLEKTLNNPATLQCQDGTVKSCP